MKEFFSQLVFNIESLIDNIEQIFFLECEKQQTLHKNQPNQSQIFIIYINQPTNLSQYCNLAQFMNKTEVFYTYTCNRSKYSRGFLFNKQCFLILFDQVVNGKPFPSIDILKNVINKNR
ncbi:unnamed protein product [Paramecium octaurelia]|uniref:Uncharacterized protein n=1 Tax=Paramecium octaurelia TaxID=43137 RepID=A0A8S1TI19_PAROT|nr:unnamed protein product [Paramecium octaurelia]